MLVGELGIGDLLDIQSGLRLELNNIALFGQEKTIYILPLLKRVGCYGSDQRKINKSFFNRNCNSIVFRVNFSTRQKDVKMMSKILCYLPNKC